MTLIAWISSTITRSTTGTVEASKIRRQLHAIMSFALLLLVGLNKVFCFDITNKAFSDQATVTDLDSDISALSSDASTYKEKEMDSMLGYIDKDTTVRVI